MEKIEDLKNNIDFVLSEWFNGRVDNMVANNPRLGVVSVYIKRGFRNYLNKNIDGIKKIIDKIELFILEDGNIDADTLYDDALKMFNAMPESKFQKGSISGTIGNGVIRFILPDGLIWNILFGDMGALKFTSEDFESLRDIIKTI